MEKVILQIGGSIGTAIYDKYLLFATFTPFILGSIAIFLFGWILAELAGRAVIGMANGLQLEIISEKVGLKHFLKRIGTKLSPSEFIAQGLKGYLIFLFFIESTRVAKLTKVAEFLTEVINYVPDLMIALFIMIVGIRMGATMQSLISTSLSFAKSSAANILGLAIKGVVITFAILAALAQLAIAPILVQIMFIGFIAMLALAGGLAFGLGGKDVVKEVLQGFKHVEMKATKKK